MTTPIGRSPATRTPIQLQRRRRRRADISVNGRPTFHVNFANTLDWNQFWTLVIPVRLTKGSNTIRFIAQG